MTKHRTITGFVTVAIIAVAATAVSVRSHSPWTDGMRNVMADPSKAPAADFEDRWSAMSASSQEAR